jgi:hypothetical protein
MTGTESKGAPLLVTPYATISWEPGRSFARFVRNERPYASVTHIDSEGLEVEGALRKAGRIRLLVDLRAVTPRNDASFEVAIARFRHKLFGGSQRIVVLVRTAIGALQVKRHLREDGFRIDVFTSEEEAIVCLEALPLEPLAAHRWQLPRLMSRAAHVRLG